MAVRARGAGVHRPGDRSVRVESRRHGASLRLSHLAGVDVGSDLAADGSGQLRRRGALGGCRQDVQAALHAGMHPAVERVGPGAGGHLDDERPGWRPEPHSAAHDGRAIEGARRLRRGPAAERLGQGRRDRELRVRRAIRVGSGVVGVVRDEAGGEAVGGRRHPRGQQGRRVEALDGELDGRAGRDGKCPREEVVEPPIVAGWHGGRHVRGDRQRRVGRQDLGRPEQRGRKKEHRQHPGPSRDAHRQPPWSAS